MGSATSIIKLSLQSNQYEQGLRGAKRQFEDFTASIGINMKKMTAYGLAAGAAAAAINSLTSTIGTAISEGTRMAKEMEGVRVAFNRLNQPGLLNNLREATHGTVNDLELMKQAVKFDNFNLSLEQMGTFLAFAQQQAKDTGQDVGYLVDSIVTGLGRKSLPILDNLGLSATEIRERMKETGDMTKAVADIIKERMEAAGGYVETAGDRAAKATADMQNAMMELGQVFAPLTESANTFFSAVQIGAIKSLTYIGKLMNTLSGSGRAANVASGENANIQKGLGKLRVAKAAGSSYMVNSLYNDQVESYNRRINDYDAQIKNGGKRPGAGSGESRDIRWLQAQRDGLVIARDQYIQQAKQIMTPIVKNTTVDTGGSSGGGGRSGGGGGKKFDISSIAFDNNKAMLAAEKGTDGGPSEIWKAITQGAQESTNSVNELTKAFEDLNRAKGDANVQGIANDGKVVKGSFSDAASSVGSLGAALAGLDDPAAKIAGVIAQSIANVALAFSNSQLKDGETGNVWYWIAAVAAGAAAMVSTIATIHSATGYAQGGIVKGNSYSGDNIYGGPDAMVNAGELVLTKAQQNTLAQNLQGGGGNLRLDGVISGESIHIVHNRYLKRTGQGEIVTW
jgi:hypothetical protein